jgi:chemotaxis protein histidine kinase CheA
VNFPEPFQDLLQRLSAARDLTRAWAATVPRAAPGAPVPDQAPAPPPQIADILRDAATTFAGAERAAYVAICQAAAAAAQRMAELPALVSAEAASALLRALSGLLAAAENPQASALTLFPQYRAMQHLAGAERIHPADLWAWRAEWRVLPPEPFVMPRQPDAQARAEIESALLALMRQPGPEACAQMAELCAALGEGQQGRLSTLWKLAAAVYEAQRALLLKPDVYLKRLGPRLLALARGTGMVPETLDLLLRDLLFHCAQAATYDARGLSARLDAVIECFGLPRHDGQEPTAPAEGGAAAPEGLRPPQAGSAAAASPPPTGLGSPLAAAVPGLPSATDLDLSDLDDWTEPRAAPTDTAAAPSASAPAAPGPGAAPAPPAPPAGSGDGRRGFAPRAAAAPARAADPIEAQFSALAQGCAEAEDALAALRRHLGADGDAYEPGSDPVLNDGVRLALDAAAAGIDTVVRTTQALRLATEALRKVRFDALTGRLHEFVGQVARESGRPVRWALFGGAETVDRTLLDRLAHPVEQLLRLSVEHGIEPAALRQQSGKQAAGYVELRVARQVDGLGVDVSDDGAAIDAGRLRAEAERLRVEALDTPPVPEQLAALLRAFTAAPPEAVADATLRRLAGWARVHPAVVAMGARLELPVDPHGRTTVRLVLPG